MSRTALLVALLALTACTTTEPECLAPICTSMRVLKASGEHPSENELEVPEGAAFRAVNVVVDKPNAYAAHKGLSKSTYAEHPLSSFAYYRGVLVAHSQADGVLLKYEGGAWSTYPGTYYAPGSEGLMSFDEAAGCLFFTTTAGVYRLDGLSATPTLSGLPQALPGTIALAGSGSALSDTYATAYRANWAINVDDGGSSRLVEGAPSPRLVIANNAGSMQDVNLTFPIPDALPDGAYLRLFRADEVPSEISPLDEMRQVYERAPTPNEVMSRQMVVPDEAPDTTKGPAAYWSANTGDGLGQSDYQAPLVQGLSHFAESEFGTGVSRVQRIIMDLIGIGAPNGLVVGQGLVLTRNGVDESYSAQATEAFPSNFQLFTSGTPAENITSTVASLVRAINSRSGGFARAFALDSEGTRPGEFLIEARTVDPAPITVTALYGGSAWLPRPEGFLVGDATRVGSTVTITTAVAHGVMVDDRVNLITNTAAFPAGVKSVVSTPTSTTFTYTEAGSAASELNKQFLIEGTPVETSTGTADNAYIWSKRFEPDHFPLPNINTVGGANDTLWWMVPMDRWAFLGSEAGLYRINGNADDGFSSPEEGAPWDSSVSFLGRRNVAYLDGQGYALSKRGLVTWSEGAKPINIDGPIQTEIREAIANYPEALSRYGFMWADATNHRVYFARPESASATSATLVHVWNGLTGTWTRLTSTFPGLEEGILDGLAPIPAAGVGYFLPKGGGGPVDREGTILTTRNTGAASDYQGPESQGLECKVTYMPWTAGDPRRYKMWSRTAVYTKAGISRLTFGYATDLLPTEQTQTYPDIDPDWPFATPVNEPIQGLAWKSVIGNEPGNSYLRGRKMSVSVEHNEPGEEFQLYGVEVQHRVYGEGQ